MRVPEAVRGAAELNSLRPARTVSEAKIRAWRSAEELTERLLSCAPEAHALTVIWALERKGAGDLRGR